MGKDDDTIITAGILVAIALGALALTKRSIPFRKLITPEGPFPMPYPDNGFVGIPRLIADRLLK